MAEPRHSDLRANVRLLVDLLKKPEKGELNYDGKAKKISRLDALRELKRLEKANVIHPPDVKYGVNLHVHTNESFSIFSSPAEAAWEGYSAGLEIMGINDHYTIDGHHEFGKACEILGLRAAFNIEAMAMCKEAKRNGVRFNDPKNPGRTYLCGKGVVRDLEPGSPSEKLLKTVRATFRRRCKDMTEKANDLLTSLDPSLNLPFDSVLRLTPRGNVTERHIAQAVAELLNRRFPAEKDRKEFLAVLVGNFEEKDLLREDRLQNLVRNTLLKSGGPAYIEEPAKAFPSIQKIAHLFRDFGAIPTYPVLGNPVTEKEKDLDSLFEELEEYGIFAVEVIPKRNTRERLEEILQAAEQHGFPVFNGTEHNTKTLEPLLDDFSSDPSFLRVFRRGAHVVLGHQFLSKYAGRGYLDQKGRLTTGDSEKGISLFSFAGKLTWPEEVLRWLCDIGVHNVLKVVLGLYSVLGHEAIRELKVKPSFRIPDRILGKIHTQDWHAKFTDEDARNRFEGIAKRFVFVT